MYKYLHECEKSQRIIWYIVRRCVVTTMRRSGVCIFNFEQVNTGWVYFDWMYNFWLNLKIFLLNKEKEGDTMKKRLIEYRFILIKSKISISYEFNT